MSSIRLRGAVVGLVLALSGAHQVRAQDAARLDVVVDSLAREWRRLRTAERRRDSVAAAQVRLDTTQVGPLSVLSDPAHAAVAVAAARIAWERVRPVLGPDSLLAAHRYYLMPGNSKPAGGLTADVRQMAYDPRSTAEELAHPVVNQLGQAVAAMANPLVRSWMGEAAPIGRLTQPELAWTYRELVTSGLPETADCVAGDLEACATLLQLHQRQMPAPAWKLLSSRRVLVQVAVEMGGDSAYRRLVADRGETVGSALEAAAGLPVDSTLRAWHRRVMAARPESTGLARKGVWGAFFWAVLFAVMATRSSRWRSA